MEREPKTFEKKAAVRNGVLKMVFIFISIILEVGLALILVLTRLRNYMEWVTAGCSLLAFLLVLGIYSQYRSSSMKMAWIVLILIAPVLGVFLYLLVGLSGSTGKMRDRYKLADEKLFPYIKEKGPAREALLEKEPSCESISRYIEREAGYPLYADSGVTFFADTSEALENMKKDLRAAKEFIFMEYFAIENAEAWQGIREILVEKAAAGVTVRVFYDELGSVFFINSGFAKELRSVGIDCRVFNPMIPVFNIFLNNRDHRKMTVVDGRVAYTGGFNIADEYFNLKQPYGHWKDSGIRIEGNAVRSLTVTFLEMWNAVRDGDADDRNFGRFLKQVPAFPGAQGFVQPYADSPVDSKPVGEDVYMSLIARAQKYIYIMTPYLILTDEMSRALCLAAKRGVDVRIVTPGIPDKKLVYEVTRSYYNRLVRDGVRIYEYTPGFCHAKQCVSDDVVAACGTINFDYRSFYHHFENGCLFAYCGAVADVRRDFEETFPVCRDVTEKYRTGRSAVLRAGQLFFRLFSPLL